MNTPTTNQSSDSIAINNLSSQIDNLLYFNKYISIVSGNHLWFNPNYIKKESNETPFKSILIAKQSILSAFQCQYGSYEKTIMVPTTRLLWYLPHERYGSYHNVVLKSLVILFGNNELIPLQMQR